mmetsp:Transcript_20187/g.47061  ORF Transcript_20187/g.47061 Transcript_20187/m.47061 type:complete len:490 (+) Transcript_20187:116-1585(+)
MEDPAMKMSTTAKREEGSETAYRARTQEALAIESLQWTVVQLAEGTSASAAGATIDREGSQTTSAAEAAEGSNEDGPDERTEEAGSSPSSREHFEMVELEPEADSEEAASDSEARDTQDLQDGASSGDSTTASPRDFTTAPLDDGTVIFNGYNGGRYSFNEDEDFIGSDSKCNRYTGVNLLNLTGDRVEIKVFLPELSPERTKRLLETEIKVQSMLRNPGIPSSDPRLWHHSLQGFAPEDHFVQLLDVSRTEHGAPGPNPSDGQTYVVYELAECSLKDKLVARQLRCPKDFFPKADLRQMSLRVLRLCAGLQAKGFVNINLTPQNVKFFDEGRLMKLDVSGCLPADAVVFDKDELRDVCEGYCSPEYAEQLRHLSEVVLAPMLDVWRVGLIICELAMLEPLLWTTYDQFVPRTPPDQQADPERVKEGRARFLHRLAQDGVDKVELPECVLQYGEEFVGLLRECLLCYEGTDRWTLAEALNHPFFAGPLR